MSHWSKLTVATAKELLDLVKQARQDVRRAPDGVGVFRAREGLVLYFSPIATDSIFPSLGLPLEECARPDDLKVEVVVGPSDEPAWYDQPAADIAAELDMRTADELGLLGPDADATETRLLEFRTRRPVAPDA